jgi:hypothetical protein
MLHKGFADLKTPWVGARTAKNNYSQGFFGFFHSFTNRDLKKLLRVAITDI